VFCTHPPIVTLGRGTQPGDVTTWRGKTIDVSRGGRATYHGPSQLVIYPILNLAYRRGVRPAKDIGGLLRDFEAAIVKVLFDLGIKNATGKTYKPNQSKKSDEIKNSLKNSLNKSDALKEKELEDTGVWVGPKKIASLGLAVRKWISFHGAALNLEYDPEAFKGMKPCGYSADVMTSVEEVLGAKPDWEFIKLRLQVELLEHLTRV
jgi:lipoyl(octanoyl) transferase